MLETPDAVSIVTGNQTASAISPAAENIAEGENSTIPQVFEGWMESKGHRENILKPEYHEIGLGIATDDKGKVFYTQVFGTPRRR